MSLYTGLGTETSSGSLVFKTSNAGSEGISGALMFSSGTTSSGASGVLEMGTGTATEGKGGYIRMTVGKTTTTQAEDGGVITLTAGETTDAAKDGGSIDINAGISKNADPTNMGAQVWALRHGAAALSSRHLMRELSASVVHSPSAVAPHQPDPVVSCSSARALQLRAREATSA